MQDDDPEDEGDEEDALESRDGAMAGEELAETDPRQQHEERRVDEDVDTGDSNELEGPAHSLLQLTRGRLLRVIRIERPLRGLLRRA